MGEENNNQTNEEIQRLKESVEDLEIYIRDFSSFLPTPICNISPLGVIIDVNRAFEKLTENPLVEIVGKPVESIFVNRREIKRVLIEAMQKKYTDSVEITALSRSGKKIPVSLSISSRKDWDGNLTGFFIAILDISEIKKIQESLEERVRDKTKELEDSRRALVNILEDVEEALKRAEAEKINTYSIVKNFSDGLLVFDSDNKLFLINPQAEFYFKVISDDVMGKSIDELSNFLALKPLVEVLKLNQESIIRKEVAIFDNLNLEVTTISVIRGDQRGMMVILHDVTKAKLVEKMKTEFVSLAAHQLRTPLSAIKWTLKMLLDGDIGKLNDEQKSFVDKSYQSNERMIGLINDLLNVTRIEEGKYLFKLVLTQVEIVLQTIIHNFQDEAARKNIKIVFKKPDKQLPKVMIDVEKITLAIGNLIDNAIRYSPSRSEVTVNLKSGIKELEVSVSDKGIGIPVDQKERVFTKFFRAANVMRMSTEGSGLGIFIAKNIIEAHGGRIWFESQENRGTIFFFTIPVKEAFVEFLKEF